MGSQEDIGSVARNLGLKLQTETVKKESTYASYAPCLATVRANGSGPCSCSKRVFGGPEMHNDQEWFVWELGNMQNFSKCAGNSLNDYNPPTDYGVIFGGPKTGDFAKYYVTG